MPYITALMLDRIIGLLYKITVIGRPIYSLNHALVYAYIGDLVSGDLPLRRRIFPSTLRSRCTRSSDIGEISQYCTLVNKLVPRV